MVGILVVRHPNFLRNLDNEQGPITVSGSNFNLYFCGYQSQYKHDIYLNTQVVYGYV